MLFRKCYVCVFVAMLTVFVLGFLNPKALQTRDSNGHHTGNPSYVWLSLWGLIAGVVVCYMYDNQRVFGPLNLGGMA